MSWCISVEFSAWKSAQRKRYRLQYFSFSLCVEDILSHARGNFLSSNAYHTLDKNDRSFEDHWCDVGSLIKECIL